LLRGAALAGGGAALYHAGKKHQARQAEEAPQDEQTQEDSQQQQAAPEAPSSGLSEEAMTQLKELGKLHDQGVLTDQEFEAQKAKILNA